MPEETYYNEAMFQRATLGRIMLVAENDEVPDEWHLADGSVMASFRYPVFVARLGITEPTFTLPAPLRVATGKFIIKLGPRAE